VNDQAQDQPKFPVGTIVYYGPDNRTVTKITAGIVFAENEPPLKQTWTGKNLPADPAVVGELGKFFVNHGVRKVVMTSQVAGCPHVEGVDYPVGEECPECPFWHTKKAE
jgi:hypothetical protein